MKPLLLFPAILLLSTVAVNLIKTADSPVIEDVDYQWDIVASDHKIPIYPGSRIIKESSSDGAYNLVLETKDQPEKVASYYKKEMQSLGWPDGTVMSVKNSAAIMLNDNGKQFALKAVFNNGVTHVNIVMLGNYNHTTMPVATVHSNDLPIALPDNSNENIYEREIQVNVSVNNNVSRLIDLRFTSPESGEIWEKGRTYTIRWDKTGGTENVKILLKDLMNQSSIWVSTGEDHVIQNTGYYSFRVPTNLPESAFELQIMTPDESYMNTSKKFYIGLTDTDLSVKAINFGKSSHYYVLGTTFYIVSEIWLKNKGTSSLNEVSVNWKIVREPSGVVEKQGNKIFKNLTPDTWYSQNIKVKYFENSFTEKHYLGGSLEPGEIFVLILNADIDNSLGEIELTRNDNTYRTEILQDTDY